MLINWVKINITKKNTAVIDANKGVVLKVKCGEN
jgi:hypothetical protein